MDEPFGALDAQTREDLQGELLELHARTHKTILFVTHDLDEAVLLADRVVVMQQGRVQEIIAVPLPRPRDDLGGVRGSDEFAETRYHIWQALHACPRRCTEARAPWSTSPNAAGAAPDAPTTRRRGAPRAALGDHRRLARRPAALWEYFGRDINPVFGSYPSAIAARVLRARPHRQALAALLESLQPFVVGYGLAIVIGVPLGLVIGRFRAVEAALGIYVTAGYAMPLVALVPLLILWLGLGFTVKAAVVFLMSVFPICINTWLGVTAVPKSLIDVGKSFVASNAVILRRIVLPATLPYIMAGIRLAVGRAVVAMVIAEFFTTISGLGAIIINSANNFDTATHVRADRGADGAGDRAQLADRRDRAPGRALAGRDRRARRNSRRRHFCRARK